MTAVSFTVYGLPKPQGSKRAVNHRSTGRAVVIESAGQPLRDWRGDVKAAAVEAAGWCSALTGPLGVSVAFTLPKPKSAPRTRRTYPAKRPDLDKLVRAVLDAMTGVVFADDAQVIALHAVKLYAGDEDPALDRPGAVIEVTDEGMGF